jgi:hypothetical protein
MSKTHIKFAKLEMKMVYSKAYQDLNAPSLKILSYVLLQLRWVKVSKNHYELSNKDQIELLYTTFKKVPFMMHRGTITRSIDFLLSHGFIKVKTQGGLCQGNKTIFEYSEKWSDWVPGECIFNRKPFFARGFLKH